jgi:hypothetical protein
MAGRICNVRFAPKSGHQNCRGLRSRSGSGKLVIFAAIRRAALRVNNFAMGRAAQGCRLLPQLLP